MASEGIVSLDATAIYRPRARLREAGHWALPNGSPWHLPSRKLPPSAATSPDEPSSLTPAPTGEMILGIACLPWWRRSVPESLRQGPHDQSRSQQRRQATCRRDCRNISSRLLNSCGSRTSSGFHHEINTRVTVDTSIGRLRSSLGHPLGPSHTAELVQERARAGGLSRSSVADDVKTVGARTHHWDKVSLSFKEPHAAQIVTAFLVLPGFQWQGSFGLRSTLPQKNRMRVR